MIPLNFGGNENLRFWGNKEKWVFPSIHFIPSHLNFQTREWTFPFPPFKLFSPLVLPNNLWRFQFQGIFVACHSSSFIFTEKLYVILLGWCMPLLSKSFIWMECFLSEKVCINPWQLFMATILPFYPPF